MSVVVNTDYNTAEVVLGIVPNVANTEAVWENLDPRQARSIAMSLLKNAQDAEDQAVVNARRRAEVEAQS